MITEKTPDKMERYRAYRADRQEKIRRLQALTTDNSDIPMDYVVEEMSDEFDTERLRALSKIDKNRLISAIEKVSHVSDPLLRSLEKKSEECLALIVFTLNETGRMEVDLLYEVDLDDETIAEKLFRGRLNDMSEAELDELIEKRTEEERKFRTRGSQDN